MFPSGNINGADMGTSQSYSRSGSPKAKRRGLIRADRAALATISRQIREKRVALGLTQVDVAGLSNTGTRFVIELEHGKPTIAVGKLIDVLTALGLTLRVVPVQEPSK